MRALPEEFYGDTMRWFVGTVVDASPPVGSEGCVRVRIFGTHTRDVNDIPQRDLPWAQVMVPGTEGGSSGIGRGPRILPGALVFGIFMDGRSSQVPMIVGSLPHIENPTSVQAGQLITSSLNPYKYRVPEFKTNDVVEFIDLESTDAIKQADTIKFFIDNGYSSKQSCAITGCIKVLSDLLTFDEETLEDPFKPQGLAQWSASESRLDKLKEFASLLDPVQDWRQYEVQLLFILRELRTTQQVGNSLLLNTTKIAGGNGACSVFIRYYVKQNSEKLPQCVSIAEALYDNIRNSGAS